MTAAVQAVPSAGLCTTIPLSFLGHREEKCFKHAQTPSIDLRHPFPATAMTGYAIGAQPGASEGEPLCQAAFLF